MGTLITGLAVLLRNRKGVSVTAMIKILCGLILAYFAGKRILEYVKVQKNFTRKIPKVHTTFQPLSVYGGTLPRSPFHRSLGFHWDERKSLYDDAPLKTFVLVSVVQGLTYMWTANLAAFRQSLGLNSDWYKSRLSYSDLLIMGENVVASHGEVWKRHRRITAPAFNHTTYNAVWNVTAKVYRDMVDKEGWANVEETPEVNFNERTHKFALFIIAIVGFGLPMPWFEPHRDAQGRLTVQAMIFNVANFIIPRANIPSWMYKFGFAKEVDESYKTFESFMKSQIVIREEELKKARALEGVNSEAFAEGIKDVFGRLVNARLADAKLPLSDEELIGNCFIFTFAGHETTANTLAATLGLLALYPESQEWVYNSIQETIGDREPTFEDYDALDGVLACFYEGIRMFPAVYLLLRQAAKDTVLRLPRRDNPEIVEDIPVKEGTTMILDFVGMCYDPQTFPDPEKFEPQRWTKSISSESDEVPTTKAKQAEEVNPTSAASAMEGFVGFSFGPRTCLGHKFAKVEAVAFLTFLLRDWRIEVELKDGETREQWRARVLKPKFEMALLFDEVPVKLIRRK